MAGKVFGRARNDQIVWKQLSEATYPLRSSLSELVSSWKMSNFWNMQEKDIFEMSMQENEESRLA